MVRVAPWCGAARHLARGEIVESYARSGWTPILIDRLTNIVSIAAGGNHCQALDKKGTAYIVSRVEKFAFDNNF